MFPLDTTTRAGRMLEAGRVTVTFRSVKTGEHITLTAKARGKDENDKWTSCPLAEALVVFIEVPNQEGWNDKVGKVTRRGFHTAPGGVIPDPNADEARVFCAKQLLRFVAGEPMPAGLEVFEESRCGRCGRQLTDPVSIERGIGPECYGMSTGSKHETKGQAAQASPSVLSPNLRPVSDEVTGDMHGAFSASSGQSSLPVASGWRARKAFVETEVKADRSGRGIRSGRKLADSDKPCSQNAITATGDEIPY